MGIINLYVNTNDTELWVQANSGIETCLNLQRLFQSMAVGGRLHTASLITEQTPVSATGTVTYSAAVSSLDTVTINGQALTATQHNSRATATAAAVEAADTVTIADVALTATQHNARATATAASVVAADTVTIASTAMTAIVQRATATVTMDTPIATSSTVTIDGVIFVGTAGSVTPGAATFSIDTGNTEAATSLAAQVNAHVVTAAKLTATSASAVVTLRAVAAGTAGNAFTLATANGTIDISGAFFTGGIAVANNQFDVSPGSTDTQVAADLARAINASVSVPISGVVTAENAAAVCTVRSVASGVGGNAITFVSSNGSRLAVTGSGFLANGAAITNNTFDFGGSNTQTAAALAACINASTTAGISGVVTAQNAAAVCTVRAVAAGVAGDDVTFVSSDAGRLAVTGSGFLAGGAAITNNTWDFGGSNTQTAAALAACINASTTAIVNQAVSATSALGIVTITSKEPGDTGNWVTLADSGTGQQVSGARLTGGSAGTVTSFSL